MAIFMFFIFPIGSVFIYLCDFCSFCCLLLEVYFECKELIVLFCWAAKLRYHMNKPISLFHTAYVSHQCQYVFFIIVSRYWNVWQVVSLNFDSPADLLSRSWRVHFSLFTDGHDYWYFLNTIGVMTLELN